MTLSHILVFCGAALGIRLLLKGTWRGWALLVCCVLAIYWLQPLMSIHYMDFWLPTVTLGLVVICWVVVTPPESRNWHGNWRTAAVMGLVVLVVGLTRYVSQTGVITASRPPQTWQIGLALLLMTVITWGIARGRALSFLRWGLFGILLCFFVIIKVPQLNELVGSGLRLLGNQTAGGTGDNAIRWLGYSYLAFRLIHTIRDRQNGQLLPNALLQEFIIYVIFFPTLTAGPIDRLPRFLKDRQKSTPITPEEFGFSAQRLIIGLFKKFVLADGLALIALNNENAWQVRSGGWCWVLVYAYAFQIFFDFSGYTDIAIGIGQLLGVRLPENFNQPYIKPNLTQFWNSWHMTLTQWIRAYFSNPLTRYLRKSSVRFPAFVIIIVTQLSTMVLIGLWHGVTWNFVIWGLWHGVGLFLQNRWSEWVKPRTAWLDSRRVLKGAINLLNIIFTFNYVALGWVWFALADASTSWHVLIRMFGG